MFTRGLWWTEKVQRIMTMNIMYLSTYQHCRRIIYPDLSNNYCSWFERSHFSTRHSHNMTSKHQSSYFNFKLRFLKFFLNFVTNFPNCPIIRRVESRRNVKATFVSFQMREISCFMTRSSDRSKTHGSTVARVHYLCAFIMRTVTPVLGSSSLSQN